MQTLTRNDFTTLEPGTAVVVNTYDSICDIGIFIRFNKQTEKAVIADCLLKSDSNKYSTNICEYDQAFLFPVDKDNLLKLLQK